MRAGGKADGKYQEDTAALGTTSFYTSANKEWAVSNTGFVNGASFESLVSSTTPVSGTADATLYSTARTSLGSLRYYVTQLQNGVYTVVLSFAEVVYSRENTLARRFFDVYLQVGIQVSTYTSTPYAFWYTLCCNFMSAIDSGETKILCIGSARM